LTPSVEIPQEKKISIWEENYASVRYGVEHHKQWADCQINWDGPKHRLEGCEEGENRLSMVDSDRSEAREVE
jgi:hypothetical protein